MSKGKEVLPRNPNQGPEEHLQKDKHLLAQSPLPGFLAGLMPPSHLLFSIERSVKSKRL
jgi:hypothetical protein